MDNHIHNDDYNEDDNNHINAIENVDADDEIFENENSKDQHMHNKNEIVDKIGLPPTIQPKQPGTKQKRRSKNDCIGRDYVCGCGKTYLSYPALYTHIKTKHNGKTPEGTNANQVQSGRGRGRPRKNFLLNEDAIARRNRESNRKENALEEKNTELRDLLNKTNYNCETYKENEFVYLAIYKSFGLLLKSKEKEFNIRKKERKSKTNGGGSIMINNIDSEENNSDNDVDDDNEDDYENSNSGNDNDMIRRNVKLNDDNHNGYSDVEDGGFDDDNDEDDDDNNESIDNSGSINYNSNKRSNVNINQSKNKEHKNDDDTYNVLDVFPTNTNSNNHGYTQIINSLHMIIDNTANTNGKLNYIDEKKEITCDQAIAAFIVEMSKTVIVDFLKVIIILLKHYRDCVNKLGWIILSQYKTLTNEHCECEFCAIKDPSRLPEIADVFLSEYLPQVAGNFDKYFAVVIISHFNFWLYGNDYTSIYLNIAKDILPRSNINNTINNNNNNNSDNYNKNEEDVDVEMENI